MQKNIERVPGSVSGFRERNIYGDAATKAYVDHHISIIQQGTLKHSVTAILSAPPANPTGLYIVGKNPTGAWSTFAGMVVMHVPGFGGNADSWAEITPGDKEERLVDADKKVYQYNAATKEWNAVAVATTGGSTVTFGAAHNVSHYDITKPGTAEDVLDATLDIWLIAESGLSFPSIEFLGFTPFQLEDARWRSDTYANSSYATDSANKAYVNSNNVTGSVIKLGYQSGGTGHQLASACMSYLRVRAKKIHGTKVHFTAELNGARKADDFPVHHWFSGIIGQPFSRLTGMRLSVAGNAFSVDAEIRGE